MYSNGKFIVPAYIALMFDVDTHDIEMIYEYQINYHHSHNHCPGSGYLA